MNWTGPYVGAVVLDIGHSTVRAGYSGDHFPSQLWPSSVGLGEGYDIFPMIPSPRSKVPFVEHVKYFDLDSGTRVINKESYVRSVRGTLKGRVHDKIILEYLNQVCLDPEFDEVSLLAGAHKHEKDCWDDYNMSMITGVETNYFPHPSSLSPSNVLSKLHSFNSVSSGLGEMAGSRPIFIVESNYNTKQNRMMETEILFEDLGVPGLHFANGSQMAAYSVGLFTSVVIDVGSATTSVSAIIDDELFAYKEYNVGGDQVDAILLDLLSKTNKTNYSYIMNHPEYNLGVSSVLKTTGMEPIQIANRPYTKMMPLKVFNLHHDIRTLKESIMRVSTVPLVVNSEINMTGTLPDGESFDVQEEDSKLSSLSKIKGGVPEIPLDAKTILNLDKITPFQLVGLSCEILFNPSIAYIPKNMSLGPFKGLVSLCEEVLKENGIYRRDIFNQTTLVGGMSVASGFQERLAAELGRASVMTPQESPLSGSKFKFVTFSSKIASKHASWIGASIVSSLGSFHNCWISKEEYDEHGPNIANRKGGTPKISNNLNLE